MHRCSLLAEWRDPSARVREFRTGVSLHSHTLHSREILDFVPRISAKIPVLDVLVRAELDRYRRIHGADLDFDQAWWTPPLSPRQAWQVETRQIASRGLQPLVSITDHDNIDAPISLHATSYGGAVPISFEWTVPFRGTFFHLGVHNLPPARATTWFDRMQQFTDAPKPLELELRGILEDLCLAEPEVLIVLNHPLWDEKGVGAPLHRAALEGLLALCSGCLHAVEWNGLRGVDENKGVLELSESTGLPLISGGDRHTFEPNACINLTNAARFADFVQEVRHERISHVLLMQHYRNPLFTRILKNVSEVLRVNPDHCLGWTRWSDRVFYTPAGTAEPVPVSSAWDREPWVVSAFVASVGLLG